MCIIKQHLCCLTLILGYFNNVEVVKVKNPSPTLKVHESLELIFLP